MSAPVIISIASLIVSAIALLMALRRNRLTAKQMTLASAISVINWLDAVRPERHLLYKIREQKKPFKEWSEEEKAAANKVTRQYDILGVLEKLGYIDPEFVDRFWAISAVEVWEICREWVNNERSLRGPNHLWEFEQLAKRVEPVKRNHPAISNAARPPKQLRRPGPA